MTGIRSSFVLLATLAALFVGTSLAQTNPAAPGKRRSIVIADGPTGQPGSATDLRRRAEDLANAASRRFSDILAEKEGVQVAPAQGEMGQSPQGAEKHALAPVWDWLVRASDDFQDIIIAELRSPPGEIAVLAPPGSPISRPPGSSVRVQSEAPVVEPRLESGSFVQCVQEWLARANRAYRNQIVKKLLRPLETMAPEKAVAKADGEPETQAAVKPADATQEGAPSDVAGSALEEQDEVDAVEAKGKADEEAEAKRVAEAAEAKRKADEEAEAKRVADAAEAQRKADEEAEAKRVADAAEAKRKAEEEAEAKRLAQAVPPAAIDTARDEMAPTGEPVPETPEQAPARVAPVNDRVPNAGAEKRIASPSRPKVTKKKSRVRKAGVRKKRAQKRRYKRRVAARTARGKQGRVYAYRKLRRGSVLGLGRTYVVRRGDTLWGIAKRAYGNGASYRRIYRANRAKIRNPNLIYPRQRLYIPSRRR